LFGCAAGKNNVAKSSVDAVRNVIFIPKPRFHNHIWVAGLGERSLDWTRMQLGLDDTLVHFNAAVAHKALEPDRASISDVHRTANDFGWRLRLFVW
jgi:hypothetical protein